MQNITTNSLGFALTIENVPATIEEATASFGGEDKVVNAALLQWLMHTHLTAVRKTIVEALEKETGVERKYHKDGDKVVYDESEGAYVNRLAATFAEDGTDLYEEYGDLISEKVNEVPKDFTRTKRASSGGKPPAKKYIEAALNLLAADKWDAFCEMHNVNAASAAELQELDKDSEEYSTAVNAVAATVRDIILERQRQAAEQSLV